MSDPKKYIVVKGKDGPKPTISDIASDCDLGLCVQTKQGESLASILRKLCKEIVKKSDGTHLKAGDNVTVTGTGTKDDPYVISAAISGSGVGLTSVGLEMPEGFTVENEPLTSNGTIVVKTPLDGIIKGDGSGFGVIILGEGLDFDGTTLFLKETTYTHVQAVATNLWIINHNLGKKHCLVEVIINDNQVFTEIEYINDNQLKVRFTNNQVGTVICKT
jgi:hypothetical protein